MASLEQTPPTSSAEPFVAVTDVTTNLPDASIICGKVRKYLEICRG